MSIDSRTARVKIIIYNRHIAIIQLQKLLLLLSQLIHQIIRSQHRLIPLMNWWPKLNLISHYDLLAH